MIQFAIPSYKRADLLLKKTLTLLELYNVEPSSISVFIDGNDPQEVLSYVSIASGLEQSFHLIKGVKGLANQRNLIATHYPIGTQVIQMDDDVDSLQKMVEDKTIANVKSAARYKLALLTKAEFWKMAKTGFEQSGLFGIYPVCNGYFMKDLSPITSDLRFIVGPFFGYTVDSFTRSFKLTLDEKEDSERTLAFYTHYGSVTRFNRIAVKTKYYSNKGGMQDGNISNISRLEAAAESVAILHSRYPKLTFLFRKKTGMSELRFKTK